MKRLIFLFLFLVSPVFSQELDATVTINNEQLPSKYKDNLRNFVNTVESYLNSTRFTDVAWEGSKIKCNFNIFFISAGSEINYSAQVVVTSQRDVYHSDTRSLMLSIMDGNWDFQYEPGQHMSYNPLEFNSLTSFLDFYAYLIIGYDYDSYEAFAGSEMYQKAFNIVILGNNSNFKNGWELARSGYNKRGLLEDLTSEKYSQFRKDFFNYHYNGLDLMADDSATGIKSIRALVENLYDNYSKFPRSLLLRIFFDAKNGELIEIFRDRGDTEIFQMLKKVDPGHISKYNELTRD